MERDQDPSEGSSSDYGEPKCKKMKLNDSVPKQVDVPTEEKFEEEDSVKDKSFGTPDEDEDSSTSTDGSEESSPRDISHLPIEFVINSQKINKMIRGQLIKEIRKFGKIYDRIFNLLEDVRGPLTIKRKFVHFAIEEARKFNRSFLIVQLKAYLESMCAYHQRK